MLLRPCQFWNEFQTKLVSEGPNKISIGGMSLRLTELQANNQQAKEIRAEVSIEEDWKDDKEVLHF